MSEDMLCKDFNAVESVSFPEKYSVIGFWRKKVITVKFQVFPRLETFEVLVYC